MEGEHYNSFGISDEKIVEILVSGAYVGQGDVNNALSRAEDQHESIVNVLLANEIISKDILGQAIAESLHVPYADLNTNLPQKEQVLIIPQDIALQYRVVLFQDSKKEAIVTSDNPKQKGLVDALSGVKVQSNKIILSYSLPEDIDEVLRYYRVSLSTRFSVIAEEGKHVVPELVDAIIQDALALRASDIHFEPQSRHVVVRFRIDDVLQEAGRLPKDLYENVVNRIKVMAHVRTDEHYATQDGAIRYEFNEKQVDMRLSIAPVIDGEKMVIRLLAQYVQDFNLKNLGFSKEDKGIVDRASHLPFGMILVTGPTGSGKTTTLYSVLKMLNKPDVNITTIEDPVEYKLEGVNHIQVNTQTDLTFAKGLRSIVRQDPNIILVGEIRDEETAEISVNAALTGHLLLSTFHANDAATAIPRLLDMGIEPFLLASTLEVIIAQRLVRKICDSCRVSVSANSELATIRLPNKIITTIEAVKTLYRGKGCSACGYTGYKGRVAIFEIIEITSDLENLIMTHPSGQEIRAMADKEGGKIMFADGLRKVLEGVTTLEELLRVAQVPK